MIVDNLQNNPSIKAERVNQGSDQAARIQSSSGVVAACICPEDIFSREMAYYYENTPIQYTENFTTKKGKHSDKKK